MQTKTSLSTRLVITAALAGAVALMSACAIDPTNNPNSGPVGSMGTECRCSTGQADCDGEDGQCQSGLVCRRIDSGSQVCTRDCGTGILSCPTNFLCKELGLGGRFSCIQQT